MPEKITSLQNEKIKELEKLLRNRKFREDSGLFVLEGATLAKEAVASGKKIHSVFYTDKAAIGYRSTIPMLTKKTKNVYVISESAAAKVSDQKAPQGIFVVAHYPEESSVKTAGDRVLILDGLQDPGNLGALARSALAFGFDTLVLSGGTVDAYSPKAQRAAMGALLQCRIFIEAETRDAILDLQKAGFRVLAAAMTDDAQPIQKMRPTKKTAVLIGNESRGISPRILEYCDRTVVIPIDGRMESLNAATAAAIIMWELRDRSEA